MSAKSIRLFEQAYPDRRPSLAVRLRGIAAKTREQAQSLLAQANKLEEMADELDAKGRTH